MGCDGVLGRIERRVLCSDCRCDLGCAADFRVWLGVGAARCVGGGELYALSVDREEGPPEGERMLGERMRGTQDRGAKDVNASGVTCNR